MKDLLNPEVLAPMLEPVFEGKLKFLDIMEVDNTLVGVPGDTVTIPQWKYIGPAEVLPEGDDVKISKLAFDKVTYTIKKYAHAVGLTDEDLLQAYGQPLNQTVIQLGRSIADAINTEVLNALMAAPQTVEYTDLNGEAVIDALTNFGEDDVEQKFMYVNPMQLAELRKNADFLAYTEAGVNAQRTGSIGNIWGCEIIDSNLVPLDTAFIAKRGFVTFFSKRETLVENERHLSKFSWLVAASKHGVVATTNEGLAVKLTKKAEAVGP